METDAFRHHQSGREVLVHMDSPELMGACMQAGQDNDPLLHGM